MKHNQPILALMKHCVQPPVEDLGVSSNLHTKHALSRCESGLQTCQTRLDVI